MKSSGAPTPLAHLPETVRPPPVEAKTRHGNSKYARHKKHDPVRGRGSSGANTRGSTMKAQTTVAAVHGKARAKQACSACNKAGRITEAMFNHKAKHCPHETKNKVGKVTVTVDVKAIVDTFVISDSDEGDGNVDGLPTLRPPMPVPRTPEQMINDDTTSAVDDTMEHLDSQAGSTNAAVMLLMSLQNGATASAATPKPESPAYATSSEDGDEPEWQAKMQALLAEKEKAIQEKEKKKKEKKKAAKAVKKPVPQSTDGLGRPGAAGTNEGRGGGESSGPGQASGGGVEPEVDYEAMAYDLSRKRRNQGKQRRRRAPRPTMSDVPVESARGESYRPTCRECGGGAPEPIMMGSAYECSACEDTMCALHMEHCHTKNCPAMVCYDCAARLQCDCGISYLYCGDPCHCVHCFAM